jgi:hypothetical protein
MIAVHLLQERERRLAILTERPLRQPNDNHASAFTGSADSLRLNWGSEGTEDTSLAQPNSAPASLGRERQTTEFDNVHGRPSHGCVPQCSTPRCCCGAWVCTHLDTDGGALCGRGFKGVFPASVWKWSNGSCHRYKCSLSLPYGRTRARTRSRSRSG